MKSLAEQKFYLGAEQAGKEMMTGPLFLKETERNKLRLGASGSHL
jgi:hypothetical protein